MNGVFFYSSKDIDSIPWPKTEEGDYAKKYLEPLLREGTKSFIKNVDTDLYILICDQVVLPFTVGSRGYDNSYVCAPISHYIEYTYDEIRHLGKLNQLFSKMILAPLRTICWWGKLNQCVMVNNWLLSTNLYPPLNKNQSQRILKALLKKFPHYAVMFRSIDLGLRKQLHDWLKDAGCKMIFSRRVHIMDKDDKKAWQKRDVKSDLKHKKRMEEKESYQFVGGKEMSEEDLERVTELYRILYVGKYSAFNPQFSTRFMKHVRDKKLWNIVGHKKSGRIDSVSGTFHINGVVTGPLAGYDTELPEELGLYRLAYLGMIEGGKRYKAVTNCSAGVARYKQLRGCRSFLEFNGVMFRHLSLRQKIPWWVIGTIANKIVIPFMLKKNL
ncbi:hypothetical protein OAK75_08195 [Bacteriovoracales bacterium]|nr:hypothetical protein [Bacteriovoracales bacterium]